MKIKYLISIIIIFYYNFSEAKEKIVFSVNNVSYSTIDIEKKTSYKHILKKQKTKQTTDVFVPKNKHNS